MRRHDAEKGKNMGHLGFSVTGLLFLLMLFIPNLIWPGRRPQGYDAGGESRLLRALERAGQAAVTCAALVFSDYDAHRWSAWTLWLAAAAALMLLYEGWWIRYFKSGRTLSGFYSSYCGVPVAGATLPVAAFFLLGVYGRVVWLMASAAILGIGHIGIHLRHRREIGQ